MLSSVEAAIGLENHRKVLGIPAQAKLAIMEKRSIELADTGEIQEVIPMSAPAEDTEAGMEEPSTTESGVLSYTEKLCWIGRYTQDFFYWELAIDDAGDLIRLRKSR